MADTGHDFCAERKFVFFTQRSSILNPILFYGLYVWKWVGAEFKLLVGVGAKLNFDLTEES